MPLRVVALPEPVLAFGQGQTAEDPRTGLALFGPHDATERGRLQIGVIGTRDGLALYRRWVSRIAAPILPHDRSAARPAFPGYAALTGTTWPDEPAVAITLARETIDEAAEIPDRHQRIFRMADIFSEAILDELQRSEVSPDLWFVIIPDAVWLHGRPRSGARRGSASNPFDMTPKLARTLRGRPSLFPADNAAALVYQHSPDFHHQLKARLLDRQVPIQIMKEGTLLNGIDEADPRTQAAIAWNLSSSTYYKSGAAPGSQRQRGMGSATSESCSRRIRPTLKDEPPAVPHRCSSIPVMDSSSEATRDRGARIAAASFTYPSPTPAASWKRRSPSIAAYVVKLHVRFLCTGACGCGMRSGRASAQPLERRRQSRVSRSASRGARSCSVRATWCRCEVLPS